MEKLKKDLENYKELGISLKKQIIEHIKNEVDKRGDISLDAEDEQENSEIGMELPLIYFEGEDVLPYLIKKKEDIYVAECSRQLGDPVDVPLEFIGIYDLYELLKIVKL